MAESVFAKSPDVQGQIPPGPTSSFKVVSFPDTTLGQTFVLYDSDGNEISLTNGLPVNVVSGGLSIPNYDYLAVTYPSGTQEVYTFKTGGSGGTVVGTVTINYTDATKANLLNVERT